MFKNAQWIGVPDTMDCAVRNGRFAYFRYDFSLAGPARLVLDITACSRYRLWVNGKPVLSGPCKGDEHRQYFETVDVSEHLAAGGNVLAVQVLLCDPDATEGAYRPDSPLMSVCNRSSRHRLAVEGQATDAEGNMLADITTGTAAWKVWLDCTTVLSSNTTTMNLGAVIESFDFRKTDAHWKQPDHSVEDWPDAAILSPVAQDVNLKRFGFRSVFPLCEREIPLMREEPLETSWDLPPEGIVIPAYSEKEIKLQMDAHTNAYLRFPFRGGRGAVVTVTYSEIPGPGEDARFFDTVIPDGGYMIYEPFWYRTFQYIHLHIETKDEPLTVFSPEVIQTGYPLEVQAEIYSSEAWVEKLWEICLRTLQNCMQETYMDCPYYEQLQYIMDTRLQVLFTYCVSRDIRLAKKALQDFHNSMLPDGLIQGRFPSTFCQVISTFSLYYIIMLEEYLRQTGDVDTVKLYRSDVDAILEYYDRHTSPQGLVENLGYWQFVDWQPVWEDSAGVPTAALCGPSTIINLMYGYALLRGADIFEATGRSAVAEEYRRRQRSITDTVQMLCWDARRGLYREGPDTQQYSQHAQAWAVLNGMVSRDTAAQMMRKTLMEPDVIQASFAASFEVFRAFEWAGCYGDTRQLLQRWVELTEQGLTTCPETPENSRSQCHAWSALPIYEFTRSIAGVHPVHGSWDHIEIQPERMDIPDLSGSVPTPKGIIRFQYAPESCQIDIPEGANAVFCAPNGKRYVLKPGENKLTWMLPTVL